MGLLVSLSSFTLGGEMPLVKTAAIVLHSRKWGDADRIVTFYTMRIGKLRGVARGARRLKSRLGGMIEPFTLCHLAPLCSASCRMDLNFQIM